jgi:hypothetical protein
MSAPPKTYRIYCYDMGQKSVTADFIKAAHDEEAIAKAEACAASKCEIWDGKRLVAQIEAERRQA